MSVDLSKCKVGDVLVRRDGKEVRLVKLYQSFGYPYITSDDYSHGVDGSVWDNTVLDGNDIVSVGTRAKRKVAKCELYKSGFSHSHDWCVLFHIGGFACEKRYEHKRSAVRGALKFCKTIGFECELTEETP